MVSVIATGSTANRTLEDRFADWVNVKDFGAVGGAGGDKAAFEAAIASVTGDSATVYVPRAASAYTIGSSVNVLGKNVTYVFEGGASVSSYDNLNGAIARPQRLVRKTYGNRDDAVGYAVRINDDDIESEILGISTDSELATYTDRDAVGMYVHNRAPAVLHTTSTTTYTSTTVSFTNAMDPDSLRVGMFIDTAHSPKYSGRIASWNAGGTQITVTGWYRVGNTAAGQVPANGTNAYVNPTTKVWAHNANVFLRSNSHATHACGFEMGIIQERASYNSSTDEPRTWGYDIVNLSAAGVTNRCSVGVIQRGDFYHGFESRDAYRAGYVATTTGSQAPTYGFLAETGQNRFAALSAVGTKSWSVDADGTMELGITTGSNTPSIDFHSSGNNNDYDVRLRATGGSSTVGLGTLTVTAASTVLSGTATATNHLVPIGGAHTFGCTASSSHQAGNAGSVGLTIEDGGNPAGVFVENTHNGTYSSQEIAFKTAKGGVSVATERARVTATGELLVGTAALLSSYATPGAVTARHTSGVRHALRLEASGTSGETQAVFVNGNGVVGSIATNGSTTAYNTSSDYRLKQDVEPLTGALDRLAQLKPSRFAFKADPDTVVDGFIAHEVQDVVPAAVTGEKDAETMQAIDQSKLIPLLTAALQEAVAKIADLTSRIAVLEDESTGR